MVSHKQNHATLKYELEFCNLLANVCLNCKKKAVVENYQSFTWYCTHFLKIGFLLYHIISTKGKDQIKKGKL